MDRCAKADTCGWQSAAHRQEVACSGSRICELFWKSRRVQQLACFNFCINLCNNSVQPSGCKVIRDFFFPGVVFPAMQPRDQLSLFLKAQPFYFRLNFLNLSHADTPTLPLHNNTTDGDINTPQNKNRARALSRL